MGDIGDMDANGHIAVFLGMERNGVIEIFRGVGVDGDDQIFGEVHSVGGDRNGAVGMGEAGDFG